MTLPLFVDTEKYSDLLRVLRSFAAGFMLSIGFIHLLGEGTDYLSEVQTEYHGLSFALAVCGMILVLGFQEMAGKNTYDVKSFLLNCIIHGVFIISNDIFLFLFISSDDD